MEKDFYPHSTKVQRRPVILAAAIACRWVVVTAIVLWSGCKNPSNYVADQQPSFASLDNGVCRSGDSTLTVVTYNIKLSEEIAAAVQILQDHPILRRADIILLQEMDERGTAEIAAQLKMNYLYFPINKDVGRDKNFGNGILAKDIIYGGEKLILPHGQAHNGRRRAVTFATIDYDGTPLLVGSAHLSTPFLSDSKRRDQVDSLASYLRAKTAAHTRGILGGDFNTFSQDYQRYLEQQLKTADYYLDTRQVGSTHVSRIPFLSDQLDAVYTKNLAAIASGVVQDDRASDHYPVWVELCVPR